MESKNGKAATRAKNKYNSNNYDRINVLIPKGHKPDILAVAEAAGDSLNGYITKAISERILREEHQTSKRYTIIGGINGTGKSSFTGVLRTQSVDLGTVIDVDRITADAGVLPIEGGKIALRCIAECFENDKSFTQETTLAGYRTLKTALIAKEKGYYISMFYIGLDTVEECLERIENRVARGGHKIDEKDVRRRFSDRWKAVKKILPLCDEAFFFDNGNGFAEVAEYVNGEFIYKCEIHPKWLKELCESD
ncbi:MAG: hypothetical protein FWD38_10185 [Oscillospiraceae bacterium]|nr:hypothetical protein [Oscillospiraceae bacterium]